MNYGEKSVKLSKNNSFFIQNPIRMNYSIIKSVESDDQNPIRMNYGEKSVKLSKNNSFLFKILSE